MRRMNVLESAQDLIDEVLHMLVSQRLAGVDDLVQIGVLQVDTEQSKVGPVSSRRFRPVTFMWPLSFLFSYHQLIDDVHIIEFGE